MRNISAFTLICSALSFVTTPVAQGAGFEKSVLWGARHVGVAGAGVSGFAGSEGIFFNPAQLAMVEGTEASLNFSPTLARLSGPFFSAPNNFDIWSNTKFLPVGGVTAGYRVNDQLGIGVGAYVAGGAQVLFNDISLTPASPFLDTMALDVVSQLQVVEYAIGAGYEITPGLRLGAAWRIVQVSADITTGVLPAAATGGNFIEAAFTDLKQTKFNGFRFGADYRGDGWGMGAGVRTSIDFVLKGQVAGRAEYATNNSGAVATSTVTALPGGEATAANRFPLQANFGGFYDIESIKLRVLGEYSFNHYGRNDQIAFTGTLTGVANAPGSTYNLANSPIIQEWTNFGIYRLGFEYRGLESTILRAGYALTEQTVPAAHARATFSSPGTGHTWVLGAGQAFMENRMSVDLAAEYSYSRGEVAPEQVVTSRPGEYRARAVALHAGVSYRF
jgi:long-subunit fatty acid transport protein